MSPRGGLPTNNRSAGLQTQPDQALSTVIRRIRLQHGMTQEGLAFEANITIASLSRVERGKSDPIWTTVLCIAAALGVSLTELTTAIEDEKDHTSTPTSHLGSVNYMADPPRGAAGRDSGLLRRELIHAMTAASEN
jgi:transcriptional regulator with XRE-family HTH domain